MSKERGRGSEDREERDDDDEDHEASETASSDTKPAAVTKAPKPVDPE